MLQFNWLNGKRTCCWVKCHKQPIQSSTGVEDHYVLLMTYRCKVALMQLLTFTVRMQ